MSEEHLHNSIGLIHISYGGPERWLSCGGRLWVFEDHPYCGPIVLTGKKRDPAEVQPPKRSAFWRHVNAWYQQGKRTKDVSGKTWCVYETQAQEARRMGQDKPTPPAKEQ